MEPWTRETLNPRRRFLVSSTISRNMRSGKRPTVNPTTWVVTKISNEIHAVELKKGLRNIRNPLVLLAGTTRLELATFPHSHAGRSNQLIYKCFALFTFYLILTLGSGGSVRIFFVINQLPGPFWFGVFWAALIVPIQTFIQILRRSNIIASIDGGLQYVNMIKHNKKSLSHR